MGISFEEERKENVVSSKGSEEDNDYETFKCLEADESVTSISVPLQDRTPRTSSKHRNRKTVPINDLMIIAEPCNSSLEYLNTIVDNINSSNTQYAPSTSSKRSVLPQ